MKNLALFGAAGKMGTRIRSRLILSDQFHSMYVENGTEALERLSQDGIVPSSPEEAASQADAVILAVPDRYLGKIAQQVVPMMKTGGMLICLDPAAPFAGELPERNDIAYFVTHPCHPPVVNDETDPIARKDFFGAIKAKQHVVAALMQGNEEDYRLGEEIIRTIFSPVMNVYRVTVEQMAILEPALSESVVLTCMVIMIEAIDEAVRHGVPAQAARDFVLGHMNVNIGILFNYIDAQLSDGAKMAVARAKHNLFNPNWKSIFEPENVLAEVKAITQGISKT